MVRTRVRWPVIALLSLALSVGFLAGKAAGDQPGDGADSARTYVVRPGETLWEIARTRLGPEADPRAFISDLAAANGLAGDALVPGTELVLPTG